MNNTTNSTVNPYQMFLTPGTYPLTAPDYWTMGDIKKYALDTKLLFLAHRHQEYYMKIITKFANSRGIHDTDHTVDSLWEAVVQSYCDPAECSGPALTLLTNKIIWNFRYMDSLLRYVTSSKLESLIIITVSRYTERITY